MLTKSKRLRTAEVEQVLKTGKSDRSTHLQVKFLLSSTMSGKGLRSAAVVPKSLARKATARNTLRRALYRALAALKTTDSKAIAVFFVRVIPKERPTAVFAEELMQLLPKMH